MSSSISRRAFLIGLAGAAAAGWMWMRDGLDSQTQDAGEVATGTGASGTTGSPGPTGTVTTAAPETTSSTTTTTTTSTTTTTLPPAAEIQVLCRESWGAAPPTGSFTKHEIERMTVHHTARLLQVNRQAPAAIRGHQRFHQIDRGWTDIAYHFMVDLEGNVYECRPVEAVGDTGTNYDPTGHFLVCCEGDFDQQELPDAQKTALVNVLAWAAAEFAGGPETIRGHRDWANTSCPGDNLYSLVESGDLAADVHAVMDSGGAVMTIVCGEEATQRVADIEA